VPHRPKPRGYEAFDIWLKTQDSAQDALDEKDWTDAQQRYITDFTQYGLINIVEFLRDGKQQRRFRSKEDGRWVRGY
jgi:hypothetical protein